MEKSSCISKYRTELMGISAIGVLLVHIPETSLCPWWLQRMLSWCGMAVYIFMFLSGVGLYYSMSAKAETRSLADYYRRRLERVILPYLLMAGIWYGIAYLLLERNPWRFLYEISTISFWLEHSSPWFIATLIPIYLLYPFYYRWMEKGNSGLKTLLLCFCVMMIVYTICRLSEDLFNHLDLAVNSLWVFMLGSYYGKRVKQGSNLLVLTALFIVTLLFSKLVPVPEIALFGKVILYPAEGLFIMVVSALLLECLHWENLCRILRWFGIHSLELYLTTQFLTKATEYFGMWDSKTEVQQYALYGMIVILGLILSALFLPLEKRLAKVVLNRG